MTDHPGRIEIERLAYDALEGEERDRIRGHVTACASCREAEQAFLKEREALSGALRPEPLPGSARRGSRRPVTGGKMKSRVYWVAGLAAAAAIIGITVVVVSWGGKTARDMAVFEVLPPSAPEPSDITRWEYWAKMEADPNDPSPGSVPGIKGELEASSDAKKLFGVSARQVEEQLRRTAVTKNEAIRATPRPSETKAPDATLATSPPRKPRMAPKPAAVAPPPARKEPSVRAPKKAPGAMAFKDYGINPAIDTSKETKSTFALDVDTASYSMIRNYLRRGMLPPKEAVRVEECLNYLRYQDVPPARGSFAIRLEVAESPFHADRHLLRIAVLAKELSEEERKDVVLTFVIDVSGSMNRGNRLGLVKQSLTLLVNRLRPADRIGVVIYGSNAGRVLDLTSLEAKPAILAAIDGLHSGGSTNAEAGLRMGYEMAAKGFDPRATNRVILCSDGVANVGRTGPEAILAQVKEHAAKGITLTTLGFGMGNYNDVLMEKLADKGNGNYAYIDTYREAKKIFTQQLTGLLEVVGYDSKIQVEFDPNTVATFRLVGYENRHVANKDFRNDKVDAGEIGSGHRVTALYELKLKEGKKGRLATVRLRYREPDTKEQVEPMESISLGQVPDEPGLASPSFRLAASVMQFAEILRQSPLAEGATLEAVMEVARQAVRDLDDPEDAREFLELVRQAAKLGR